jgi:uncharacterized protein YnzC (UPF0291/DUF896 family)
MNQDTDATDVLVATKQGEKITVIDPKTGDLKNSRIKQENSEKKIQQK